MAPTDIQTGNGDDTFILGGPVEDEKDSEYTYKYKDENGFMGAGNLHRLDIATEGGTNTWHLWMSGEKFYLTGGMGNDTFIRYTFEVTDKEGQTYTFATRDYNISSLSGNITCIGFPTYRGTSSNAIKKARKWIQMTDGSWKYRKEDGTMAASEWITHLNRRYYLNADEIMCTGLSMVNGKLYYFESWGGAGFQGWKKVGGTWYYLNEDGSLRTNQWFVHDKRTYHVDADGVMSTGWQTIDGVDYYFESWGGMRVNAWAAKGSDWYYMDSNGTPKGEGWLLYDKNWYYLRQDGKMMHSEWLWYDNNWYYLRSWGGMYKSQWVTIKGATYYFRSWGGIYKNGWQEVDGKTYYFRSWGGIYKDTYIDGYYVDKNGVRRNSKNICVAIDAGHQRRGNSEKEPIGPGSSTYKAKVASGTCGVATGINEYELNLAVSLKVRDILEERGYDVYMIRETHDVNISNSERAKLAAQNGADILVRVHANGDSNQSVYGALTMAPSSRNTYLSGDVISKSQKLSQKMIAAFCKDTGAKNRDVIYTDSMSGINWSTIPVTIIELGFMSNPSEDRLMATEDYRNKMAQGIADGIDAYYE